MYEVTQKTTVKYTGNYSKYLVQKAERYEKELRQYEKQQDEVAKLNDFIQRKHRPRIDYKNVRKADVSSSIEWS